MLRGKKLAAALREARLDQAKRLRNIAKAYERCVPIARRVAMDHGYALTVHGTLLRDIDLVAVPWVEDAAPAADLVEAITIAVGGYIRKDEKKSNPSVKPHGRRAWSIYVAGGTYLDLSVMPTLG